MNKQRRTAIAEIAEQISEARDSLESIRYEEEEAYENYPDSLKDTERGEAMQNAIETLDEAYSQLEEAIDLLLSID